MADHLGSKSLVPFKKHRNGYRLPGMAKEQDEQMVDQVDPDLRPDEQGYIRHYLAYADTMLASCKEEPSQTSSPQDLKPEENKADVPEIQKEVEKEVQKSDSQESAISGHTPVLETASSVPENSNPEAPADDRAA
jgi:hypothetical protein